MPLTRVRKIKEVSISKERTKGEDMILERIYKSSKYLHCKGKRTVLYSANNHAVIIRCCVNEKCFAGTDLSKLTTWIKENADTTCKTE